jgi:hypothetical protein
MKTFMNQLFVVVRLVLLALLASACGGGGSSSVSSSQTSAVITGVAATGAAIAGGTVTAKCASGTATGITTTNGSFTLTLAGGQVPPCLLQVTSVGSPSVTLYSFADGAGNYNINPLTDMAVAKSLSGSPDVAFTTFSASSGATISSGLAAAKTYVNASLTTAGLNTPSVDLFTGAFAVGDPNDRLLDTLAAALRSKGKSLADLRTVASTGAALTSILGTPIPTTGTPTISSFAPLAAIAGSTVTITGTGFNTSVALNKVKFATGTADVAAGLATVTGATATELKVTVPAAAVSGPISILNTATTSVLAVSTVSFTLNSSGPSTGGGGGALAVSASVASIGNGSLTFTGASAVLAPSPVIRAVSANSLIVVSYVAGTGSVNLVTYYWGNVQNVNGSDIADHFAICSVVLTNCGVTVSNGNVTFANTVVTSGGLAQATFNGSLAVDGLTGISTGTSSGGTIILTTSACTTGPTTLNFPAVQYYDGCGASSISDFGPTTVAGSTAGTTQTCTIQKSGANLTVAVQGGATYTAAFDGQANLDVIFLKSVLVGRKAIQAVTGNTNIYVTLSADSTSVTSATVTPDSNSPAVSISCGVN